MDSSVLVAKAIVPQSALSGALLYGAVYAVDHSDPGLRLLLEGIPPFASLERVTLVAEYAQVPVSTFDNATLYAAIKGQDHSGAGILRQTLYAIDHSTDSINPFTILGIGTRVWSMLDSPVLTGFQIHGTGARSWQVEDNGAGQLVIAGTSTRAWAGTEMGEPEAFRIHGVGTRAWTKQTGFRIDGTCTRRWTPSIGIADECITADGVTTASAEVKNYVY